MILAISLDAVFYDICAIRQAGRKIGFCSGN